MRWYLAPACWLALAGCAGSASVTVVAATGSAADMAESEDLAAVTADIPPSVLLLHDARVLIPLACWDPTAGQIVGGEACLADVSDTAVAELADGEALEAVGKHAQRLCGAGRAGRGSNDTAVLDVEALGERDVAVLPDRDTAQLSPAPRGPPALLADKRDQLLAFVAGTVEEQMSESGLQVLQAIVRDLDGDGADEIAYAAVYTPGTWPPLFAGIAVERTDGSTLDVLPGHDWRSGAVTVEILATSDLDRDGAQELVLFERWVDGYYVEIREFGEDEPLYRIGCGES